MVGVDGTLIRLWKGGEIGKGWCCPAICQSTILTMEGGKRHEKNIPNYFDRAFCNFISHISPEYDSSGVRGGHRCRSWK